MEIICCQPDVAWENPPENFQRIPTLLDDNAISPGSLVVLPELCTTGFTMNVDAAAEPADGPTSRFLSALAQHFQCHLIAGVAGRDDSGRGLNEALLLTADGNELARYRKTHLFSPAGEDRHYAPGSEAVVLRCGDWNIAPLICYDLRFPELFRQAVRQGAELFVVIANWPAVREDHWLTLLRARAIENQAYVAGVNRCGSDPNHDYSGKSMIVGPTGDVLAQAGSGPEIIRARLDHDSLIQWRHDFPALADMKPA